MKMILSLLISLFAAAPQQPADSVVIIYRDSLVQVIVPQITDSLVGKSIYDLVPEIGESESVRAAVDSQMVRNSNSLQDCWRIRIFFDNKQKSREASLASEQKFKEMYPSIPTYRTFKSPFFKVTVGDFRTKADASAFLADIVDRFPSAFVVQEQGKFPVIDYSTMFAVDTLKIPVDTIVISNPVFE